MIRSATILIALMISRQAWAQVEQGPVAYWSFDEGQGLEVRDDSGHNHHGSIRGGAKWVPGRAGTALELNGVDALVEIAHPEDLNLEGDLTFMAWVQTSSDDSRDQLIFGDTAGRAVNRHITIELDRGDLYVGHGNDTQYESFSPGLKFEGDWKHLALIMEYPRYFLYVNGTLCETGELTLPVSRTHGAGRAIGGWFAGYFKGVLDEVRLYHRALSEREILAVAKLPAAAADQTTRISLAPRLKAGVLSFSALFTQMTVSDATLRCELTLKGESQACRVFSAPLIATRPHSECAFAQTTIPLTGLSRGTYLLTVMPHDATGKVISPAEEVPGRKEVVIPEPPAWFGSQAGISDTVLPPYTPVQVSRTPQSASLSVWGRTYRFSDVPLLDQVDSRDSPLLRGPVRLRAVVDGKELSWRGTAPRLDQQSPTHVTVTQHASDGPLTLQSQVRLEYDGFLRTDITLAGASPVQVQSLALEIPIQREHARYLYTWPTSFGGGGYSGELSRPMQFSFHPIVWIGDEACGLSWMCESENGWAPDDRAQVIQVVPGNGEVTLRIRLIGKPTVLSPDQPLKYVFAFQATPLKPMGDDGWTLRFGSCPWYGDDYDLLTDRQFLGQPGLIKLKELGVRTLIAWNWTPALAYPWPLQRAAEFKALVEACHAQGIRVIPYLGYQISEKAPEFPYVREEVVTSPASTNSDKYPGKPSQMVSAVCLRSVWQDALVDHVSRMMEEFDIDGVYMDSGNLPFPCMNELHGCEARLLDGTRVPVYPVFAVRDTFRRVYTVVKDRKADGIVDNHVFDCMNSGALAFATSYWNGEQLSSAENPTDALPLDRFRTEFTGSNWGVPCDLLSYKLGSYRKSLAVSLPHDILVRFRQDEIPVDAGENEAMLGQTIWKLADDFGRSQAQFTPYYSPLRPLQGLPADWIASMYRHPSHGALVIVSNLGREQRHAALTPDWKTLGIEVPGPVLDGLTRAALPLKDGILPVTLPSGGWQYLWLQRAP